MFCLEDTQQCAVEIKLLDCYKPEFLYANFWSESRPWMVYYNAVMIPKAIYMSLYMALDDSYQWATSYPGHEPYYIYNIYIFTLQYNVLTTFLQGR